MCLTQALTQKEDALELWGEPKCFKDITTLFSKFCTKQLAALPWCDQAPAKETSVIAMQLSKINELGFLTINSQPAVNGAKSEDNIHGWGPSKGYVYQKAYLEFFVKPELLSHLLKHVDRDSNITYYVINKTGDLRTNTHSEGPNAVTWGVFPGKEIIQPTIVEAVSFMAWKVDFTIISLLNDGLTLFPRTRPLNWDNNGLEYMILTHRLENSSPISWRHHVSSTSSTTTSTTPKPFLNRFSRLGLIMRVRRTRWPPMAFFKFIYHSFWTYGLHMIQLTHFHHSHPLHFGFNPRCFLVVSFVS